MKNSLSPPAETKHMVSHREFVRRIKKTLYYGSSSAAYQCDRISRPLADYAAEIFSDTHKGTSLNRIDFAMVSKLKVTPCSLIVSMIYLDRLNNLDPAYAHRITPSELFLVAMFTASKFLVGYDEFVYLSEWADYGNMSEDHLKELELDFLDAMNWDIYVSGYDFFEKLKTIEKCLAKRQGLKRGWLTYTELFRLMPTLAIAKQLLSYSAVLALSYCAGVITIASGFFFASQVPGTSLNKCTKTSMDSSVASSRLHTTAPGIRHRHDIDSNVLDGDDIETELLDHLTDEVNESVGRYETNKSETVPEIVLSATKNRTAVNQKPPDPGTGFIVSPDFELCASEQCGKQPDIGGRDTKTSDPQHPGDGLKGYLIDEADISLNCTQKSWLTALLGGQQINPSFNTIPTVWLKFI